MQLERLQFDSRMFRLWAVFQTAPGMPKSSSLIAFVLVKICKVVNVARFLVHFTSLTQAVGETAGDFGFGWL